jgi:predicted nucleic acid-binding Zn ribbon protein
MECEFGNSTLTFTTAQICPGFLRIHSYRERKKEKQMTLLAILGIVLIVIIVIAII